MTGSRPVVTESSRRAHLLGLARRALDHRCVTRGPYEVRDSTPTRAGGGAVAGVRGSVRPDRPNRDARTALPHGARPRTARPDGPPEPRARSAARTHGRTDRPDARDGGTHRAEARTDARTDGPPWGRRPGGGAAPGPPGPWCAPAGVGSGAQRLGGAAALDSERTVTQKPQPARRGRLRPLVAFCRRVSAWSRSSVTSSARVSPCTSW